MRVCLVYDCLFPHTVGGAERWYRDLASRLVEEGHEVTYLTMRQWPRGEEPDLPGARVVAVAPRMELYTGGRRAIVPPLVFGLGVACHLLRHGRRYQAVHTASFPYFSLLAAALARPLGGFRLVVDWFEVWSRDYWAEYLGRAGAVGWLVQRLCARVRQRAFCFSELHARRLRAEGLHGTVTMLAGLYGGPREPRAHRSAEPVVVFAGRHIPEKRVGALVPAIAAARARLPELKAEIYGDGPDRESVLRLIADRDAAEWIAAPGFVASETVEDALARALCLVLPSRREGYGLIVVEAASVGTPSIVVAGIDNAATELVEDGVNGFVAPTADPEAIAEAIAEVHSRGRALRQSTAAWFATHAEKLSVERSLDEVSRAYAGG